VPAPTEDAEPRGIHPFGSEAELDGYMGAINARAAEYQAKVAARIAECAKRRRPDGDTSGSAAPTVFSAAAPSNENVTNNQEAGVDEGGIVKNVGTSLVVLRKGRLYIVDVSAAPKLVDSMRVARTESLNNQVWYDEMLVKGDLVYVVGYRYGVAASGESESVRGATEIDSFRLQDGKLTRLKTMYLESNDYYSRRNYASRMVDGKLVFYMPHVISRQGGKLVFPRVLEGADNGTFTTVGPIFGALDVMTSLSKPVYPTFHTIVHCELPASGDLACHGRSVIGSYWRETYVSSNAAYLWASSHVYRFDLSSLDVRVHAAEGHPVDQFSFRQSNDALLVAASGNPSHALLSLPLAAFDKFGKQVVQKRALGGSIVINRFVGDVLVAAMRAGSENPSMDLVSLDAATGRTSRTSWPDVARIEPLDQRRAVIASSGSQGLTLSVIGVDDISQPRGSVTLRGAKQGEARSHGFFYKPTGEGAGTFGYAVLSDPMSGSFGGWGNGISNLGFFDVTPTGSVAALGIVSSGNVQGTCETSCVDWYGNTRPIFLGSRVFALMGSELSEVTLRPSSLKSATALLEPPTAR